jgi:hypothetical protein
MDRGTKKTKTDGTWCTRMVNTLVFMHQAFAHLTVCVCVSAEREG